MPADLLTIAFALTLVVNALFVLVAIRALRLGRFDAEHPARDRDTIKTPSPAALPRPARPDSPDVVRAVAARRAALANPESARAEPEPITPAATATAPAATVTAPAARPAPAVAGVVRTRKAAPTVAAPTVAAPAVAEPDVAEPEATEAQAGGAVSTGSAAAGSTVDEPETGHMTQPAERLLAELEAARAIREPGGGAEVDDALPASRRPQASDASDVSATHPSAPEATPPGRASEMDRRGPPKGRGKGRRKFSLPPLDDDHEKVSRSIESFLAGADSTADSGVGGSSGSAGGAATTVALIAIVGAGDDPADDEAAAAMVERTLRSAARGTDVVEVEDRARFRIVLSATGELAARAYLRRVRATVEPLLEAADRPLRLVIATATVLDEPAETAAAIAARRLELALAAVPTEGSGDGPLTPRAAATDRP